MENVRVESQPSIGHSSGRKLNAAQAGVKLSRTGIDTFPNLNSTNQVFQADKNIQFTLDTPNISWIDAAFLEMTIGNSNVAACTLVSAPWLINRIELRFGSNNIHTYYPEASWFQYLSGADDEETRTLAAFQNWDPTTYDSAGNTIAAGGSATYTLRLRTFLDQLKIPLQAANRASFQFRIYMNFGSMLFDSGSAHSTYADLSLDDVNLYCIGPQLEPDEQERLISQYRASDHVFWGVLPERNNHSLGTVSTGERISQVLTTLDGRYTRLVFFCRANNASGEELYQLDGASVYALDDLTLKENSGRAYTQENLNSNAWKLWVPLIHKYNSRFQTIFNAYYYDFSETASQSAVGDAPALAGGSTYVGNNWKFQGTTRNSGGANIDLLVLSDRVWKFTVKSNGDFIPQEVNV